MFALSSFVIGPFEGRKPVTASKESYRLERPKYPRWVYFAAIGGEVETRTYAVPGMHCGHCPAVVTEELKVVQGVESVEVDLDAKLVTANGRGLDDTALRAAIDEAGSEVAA